MTNIMETIRSRHSVRSYQPTPIAPDIMDALQAIIDECARESGLNIQLVADNPEAFDVVGKFGLIRGASSHISFVAKDKSHDEAMGYWGQKIVLAAQDLGLNTCWMGIFAKKKAAAKLGDGEKIRIAIAVGYGKTSGSPRKTKSIEELSAVKCAEMPGWFEAAMEAAQLAPTAVNAQNFKIILHEDGKSVTVEAPSSAFGAFNLGIVKCNFELAANYYEADWRWA